MSNEDPFGVHIGAREIYDQLVAMREDVRSLAQDREDTEDTLRDHEDRLRAVERFKHALPLTAIGALLTAVASLAKASGVV